MKYYSPVAEGSKYYIKEYHINGIKPEVLYWSIHFYCTCTYTCSPLFTFYFIYDVSWTFQSISLVGPKKKLNGPNEKRYQIMTEIITKMG